MIVCVCHRVSDRDIAHAARHGCSTFDDLQDQLLVGTACGACGDCARDTFEAQRPPSCPPLTAAESSCVSCLGHRRAAHSAPAPHPAGPG